MRTERCETTEANMDVSRVPIDDRAWREFTSSHPDATPFHLPAWAALIADCYRFQAFALTVRSSDGEILGGIPTVAVRFPLAGSRWISLPFTDSCPVLVRPGTATDDVVVAIREHACTSHIRELEVRHAMPAADGVYPVDVATSTSWNCLRTGRSAPAQELPAAPQPSQSQGRSGQSRHRSRAHGELLSASRSHQATPGCAGAAASLLRPASPTRS